MDSKLATLPLDVILNHILPFLYQPQPQKLLEDIRSYVTDYNILQNVYLYEYNYSILYHDIRTYCIGRTRPYSTFEKLKNIVGRHVLCKTNAKIMNTIRYIHDRSNPGTEAQKIKFLWGLLTPQERTDFINKMVIEEYQEIQIHI
jgi:hypothetical protein